MKELAKQCIEHVGGAANIQAVSHCATRLRLTLRDQSQVNEAALTALPEVIKVMRSERDADHYRQRRSGIVRRGQPAGRSGPE